jgi:hypothetical protein
MDRSFQMSLPGVVAATVTFNHVPKGYGGTTHAVTIHHDDGMVTVHHVASIEVFKIVSKSLCANNCCEIHRYDTCDDSNAEVYCTCPITDFVALDYRHSKMQDIAENEDVSLNFIERICDPVV